MAEIPDKYKSYDSGEVFSHCLICNRSLQEPPVSYMVEKCFRRYPDADHEDVIYEYAMCIPCLQKQQEFLSSESMQKISAYLQQMKHEQLEGEDDASKGVPSMCSIHGTNRSEMNEYILQGLFNGQEKSPAMPLICIGEKAMEELQELLSAKTRDGMDDFMDTHFSGPPEVREILRERKKVII